MADRIVIPIGTGERGQGDVAVDRGTAIAVARIESRDAALGMITGLIVIILGALLVLTGVGSPASTWELKFGTFEMTLTTAVPGIVFAVIGFLIVFITRPKVVLREGPAG